MSNEEGGCSSLLVSSLAGLLFFSLIGYGVGAILPFITAYGTSKVFGIAGVFIGLFVGLIELGKSSNNSPF
ncbi:MAG: hypothetical protein K8R59_00535 [Thermoanaerobaculales bacterium]|nr:hypothetical protein [Thermoanaerobaculales bacterium]